VPSLEPVIVGSNFTYTIQVNNNGGSSFTGVTNSVQLSTNVQVLSVATTFGTYSTNYNPVTGWLVTFNLGTLTNYSVVTQTITLGTLAPGFTTNVVNLTSLEQSAGLEPNTGNNKALVPNTILGIVDVKISQLSASANTLYVGSNFNYTLVVSAKGQYVASSIAITDALPPQVVFNLAASTNSQGYPLTFDTNSATVSTMLFNLTNNTAATITLNVTPTFLGTGTNFAGITPFDYDPVLANNFSNLVSTFVAPPVQILAPTLSGTNLIFSFQTVSNQSYTIQQNTNVATTNWTLFSNFIANGSVFQLKVPARPGTRQFFRVREP